MPFGVKGGFLCQTSPTSHVCGVGGGNPALVKYGGLYAPIDPVMDPPLFPGAYLGGLCLALPPRCGWQELVTPPVYVGGGKVTGMEGS